MPIEDAPVAPPADISVLTEDDKKRIRAEVYYSESTRRELAAYQGNKATQPRTLWDWFNSPGCVALIAAVVGGIAVSWAGSIWQNRAAEHQKTIDAERLTLERKRQVLIRFRQDYASALMTIESYELKRTWLILNMHNKGATDEYGQSVPEVRKIVNSLWARYSETASYDTILPRIQSLYQDPSVRRDADKLSKETNKF